MFWLKKKKKAELLKPFYIECYKISPCCLTFTWKHLQVSGMGMALLMDFQFLCRSLLWGFSVCMALDHRGTLSHNITLIHPKLVHKFSFQEIQDVSSWASNLHRSNIKASQGWHGSCLVEPWTPPGMQPPASLSLSSCVWPPQDEGLSLHLPGTFLAAVPATASRPSSVPQEAPGSSPQGAEGGRRILQPSPGLHKPTSQPLLTQSHAPASVL